MSKYSLSEFVSKTSEKDHGEGFFELESTRMLEVNLNGMVWTKMGSMIAYNGNIKFTREGCFRTWYRETTKKDAYG